MKAPNNTLFDKFAKFCFSSYANLLIGVLAATSVMMIPIVCLAFLILHTPSSTETSVVTTTINIQRSGGGIAPASSTTTTTTTAVTTTTTCTTSTTVTTVTTTTEETTTSTTTTTDMKDSLTYLGSFTGTYFKGDSDPCNGGSGRILIPCDIKDDTYKGSVASQFVFNQYGYERNGKTMIYIEFPTIPEMNGWYSVDDYNADPSIIDFYFPNYSKCPWQQDGVIQCVAWIS